MEVLGADAYAHGTIAGSEGSIVLRCDGRIYPSIGDAVRATVDHTEVHVFHPETGERIG